VFYSQRIFTIFMTKPTILIIVLLLLLTSCAPVAQPAPYSAYYFVTVGPDATATPTPFQPYAPVSQSEPQTAQLVFVSPTLPPPPVTSTPLATSTLPPEVQPTPEVITQPQPVIDNPEIVTFLLLGSDTRGGTSFRTDTILIGIVRPRDGQVSLISIPRDLWVNIPTVGMQRINTAYQFGQFSYPSGGAGLLKDTILYNLGLKIDHTAMIDFDGFRKVVDTFGGIDVPISCPYTDWRLLDPSYDPENENNWFLYTAGPGVLHMDGDLALWYARSRKKSNDFDRGRRQQEVIRAIYKQALRTDSIARIPQLYTDLSSLFTTDLGLADILKLAPMALHLSNADIRSYYIAGNLVTSWITPGGAYVLLPNTELIQQMLNQAISASPLQQERKTASIEIQNGSPTDGWDALAAERLNYAGFQTSFNVADNRSHANTLLYDLTPDQDRNRVSGILAVLGLPETALVSLPSPDSKTSYALIVGADYNACFDPAGLTP
jgi:polyisoprenyl-teichoic acid--peptidoglycan teichoic acid transferase